MTWLRIEQYNFASQQYNTTAVRCAMDMLCATDHILDQLGLYAGEKTRKVNAGKRGLWKAPERPGTSRLSMLVITLVQLRH